MPTIDIRNIDSDEEDTEKVKFDDSSDYLYFDSGDEVIKFYSEEFESCFTLFSARQEEQENFKKALNYLIEKNS